MIERIIAIAAILISGYWIQQGIFNYGFWKESSPAGGFVPTIFGILVAVLSFTVLFRRTEKDKKKIEIEPAALIPVGAAVGGFLLIQIVGIAAAVFLFTTAWMKFLSKYSWLKSLFVGVVFTVFIYLIFRLWLSVPFPKGILGIG